jgi:hypothetical protein
MSNNDEYVIIVYKEVGKDPEFRKIKNSIAEFEKLVNGKITTIHFEDIEIIYKKDSNNLRPNIYIKPDFLGIGLSIRGNLFVINKNDDSFSTLNKEQAIKCREMLIRKSFNYKNSDEYCCYAPHQKRNQRKKRNYNLISTASKESVKSNYPYVIQSENNTLKNKGKLVLEKSIDENDDYNEVNLEDVFKMILGMQATILRFIKTITGE